MDYITVQLPKDFAIQMIDALVEQPGLGYSSRSEVVKDAIRDLYLKLSGFIEEVPANRLERTRNSDILVNDAHQVILSIFTGGDTAQLYCSYPENQNLIDVEQVTSLFVQNQTQRKIFHSPLDSLLLTSRVFEIKNPANPAEHATGFLSVITSEQTLDDYEKAIVTQINEFVACLQANAWTYDALIASDDQNGRHFEPIKYWIRGLYDDIFNSIEK
jgi:Arc/MetJ-type ribon-helix-helix transcriptional regulator